jgi:hypothetical protein
VNARSALGALAEQGREPALLVGRSLGSVALLRREEPSCVRLPSVWIAPLMHREPVRESLLHGGGPCFVLCGGRDPAYDTARALAGALEQLRDFLRR